jgi:hypothetical protein
MNGRVLDHLDHLGGFGSNRLHNCQCRGCLHLIMVVEPVHCARRLFEKEGKRSDIIVLLCGHSAIFPSSAGVPRGAARPCSADGAPSASSLGLRSPAFQNTFRLGSFRPDFSSLDSTGKLCNLIIFLHASDTSMQNRSSRRTPEAVLNPS